MIWAALACLALAAKVAYDIHVIQRRERRGPIHEADVRAAARPMGHVDIVGGGYRVR